MNDAAELVGHFAPGSPVWYEAREGAIGGSDVAAILGLSRFESRFSLWHRIAGKLGPQPENDEMRAGKYLEPAICSSFADTHPDLLVIGEAGTWRSFDRPWQIGNPDAFVQVKGEPLGDINILEAKFALYDDEWGDEGTDQIPPAYLAQTRWYLDVFDAKQCWVQVFIGSSAQFRTYLVERDEEDQAFVRDQVRKFLDSVTAGERPSIDEHGATYEAVRRLHPGIEPVDVDVEPAIGIAYIETLRAKKAATAAARQASSQLLDAVGGGRRAMHAGAAIALRIPGRGDNAPFLRPARGLTTDEED